MVRQDEYRQSGVDYQVLDVIKREATALAAATGAMLGQSGGREITESRGSTAYVFELNGALLAMVIEGLGTKSVIAADYQAATGTSRFADVARDAVAAIINDVISVGANPLVVTAYFATGDAAWYNDRDRAMDLLNGWQAACEEAGATWGSGESPALPGIVMPDAIEIGGSALGLVPPGRRPVFGTDIAPGDKIVLLPSSGLHANGASLARRAASRLLSGLLTELPGGRHFGDALLDPSLIYAPFTRQLLGSSVVPVFLNPITGHGLLKVMRAEANLRYEITTLPHVPEVLECIVEALDMPLLEAYSTLNMGAGYVVIVRPADVDETIRIARATGHEAFVAGQVAAGNRALAIEPLGLEYGNDDLRVR